MFDELEALIVGLVDFLLTQGFILLGDWMKKDLKGTAAFVVFVVSAGLVAAFDALYFKVPEEYRDLVNFLAKAIVSLVGGSGMFRLYAKLRK